MRDVIVLCEGRTEKEFCRGVISPALGHAGVSLSATLVGKPQRKRGGIQKWPVYRDEVLRLAKERPTRVVSVLVDYYAMPHSWPGRSSADQRPVTDRGRHVEEALVEELRPELGSRFVPCVQLHEFESLLFVSPAQTANSMVVAGSTLPIPALERRLTEILRDFGGSAERINDSPTGAPSKRLVQLVPGYDKVLSGYSAAKEAGLEELRAGCPWLDRWMVALESLDEV